MRSVPADLDEAAVKAAAGFGRRARARRSPRPRRPTVSAAAARRLGDRQRQRGQRRRAPVRQAADRDEAAEHLALLLRQADAADQRGRSGARRQGRLEPRRKRDASCPRTLSDASSRPISTRNGPRSAIASACSGSKGRGVQLFERIEGDHFTILGMPLLPLLGALREREADPRMIGSRSPARSAWASRPSPRCSSAPASRCSTPMPRCAGCRAAGGALVAAIDERFPGTVSDGAVDRDALAARVLGQARRARRARGDRPSGGARRARALPRSPTRTRRRCCSTFPCCSKPTARTRSTR